MKIIKNKIIFEIDKFKIKLKEFEKSKFFIITDETIYKKQGLFLEELFGGLKKEIIIVSENEQAKTLYEYEKVTSEIINLNISKNDVIVSFGGGSVGDLAGFVAGTILRGVNYLNIPTTLLAMVDSSIGGKVGINTKEGKNLLGVFKAGLVLIHLPLLNTLDEKELINGYSEIVKSAFISDRKIFDLMRDNNISEELIRKTQKVKLKITKKDYYEHNLRKILNFGHTFGHAIEKESNYKVPHGIAVFQGMEIAFKIGIELNVSKEADLKMLYNFFDRFSIKPYQGNLSRLVEDIKFDKKVTNGFIDFILIDKKAVIYSLKVDFLYELLR